MSLRRIDGWILGLFIAATSTGDLDTLQSVAEFERPQRRFPISLNGVSKHVKVLERAGLVERTVQGREHRLRLNAEPLREAAMWLEHYRTFWDTRLAVLPLHRNGGDGEAPLLAKHFGSEFPVEDLTPDRIRDYVRLRREGTISGHVAGASTIHRDLGMLKATLNWAGTVYESRRPILERNPLDKVKFPREKDPKRPVIDEETIECLLTVADEVHPYLRPLIVLARRTGRRLSAILNLRWDDVDLTKGMIRWRAEHDKVRRTWMVPMHPEVHAELLRLRKMQGAIGNTLLFPHPKQERRPGQAVSRHLAAWWLKEAFRRGKLPKPDGSLWHTFRRVWATERKHLPPNDVAAAGGWLDTGTLQQCYQQCDPDTLRSVVEFERPEPPVSRWLSRVTK